MSKRKWSRLSQPESDGSASCSDEEWQRVEDEEDPQAAATPSSVLSDDVISLPSTGSDDALPAETDCGAVYASARRSAEASFVRGAGKQARPHQADAVAKLLSLMWLDQRAAQTRPINYLVQHATGSGKSLTIAALALSLLSFTTNGSFRAVGSDCESDQQVEGDCGGGRGGDVHANGGDGGGESFFSMVIVITDRLQLDRQLGDTVEAMLNAHNERLVRCSTSAELHDLLLAPAHRRPRAVLSTLQKFAGLGKGGALDAGAGSAAPAAALSPLKQLLAQGRARGRIALIADEAHRSHGGGTSLAINQLLGGRAGQSNRMTYIAFSATPSHAALRLFGVNRRGSCGPEFAPAHCYSLGDAIRDGLVVDVLAHYTCIKPRFCRKLPGKQDTEGKPKNCQKSKSTKQLSHDTAAASGAGGGRGASVSSHSEVIDYKASVIARHFARTLAAARRRLGPTAGGCLCAQGVAEDAGNQERGGAGFRPRGMLVCRSRADVVAYTHAIRRILSTAGRQEGGAEGLRRDGLSWQHIAGLVGVRGEGGEGGEGSTGGVRNGGADVQHDWEWSVYGAFSGEVRLPDGGGESESGLNGASCLLHSAELLVVCNKLETGYDEPRIANMYIDRVLSGARWCVWCVWSAWTVWSVCLQTLCVFSGGVLLARRQCLA